MAFKRLDFPIFSHRPDLVYLDTAATAQKPTVVISAEADFYASDNASVHRGVYGLSEAATQRYEEARGIIAKFMHAHPDEIVFTSGATEGINAVADGFVRQKLQPGDEIVISAVEHHANLLPWQRLAQRTGVTLKLIPFDLEQGILALQPDDIITAKTRFLAMTLDSNVVGPVWQDTQHMNRFVQAARAVGASVLCDAAQYIPHQQLDVRQLDVDFIVWSGHKALGPTGVGVLYINRRMHEKVEPYRVGGMMVFSAGYHQSIWHKPPLKFEAGTPPIAQAIALKSAVEYLQPYLQSDALRKHERDCMALLIDGLQSLREITILGNAARLSNLGHLVTFVVEGVHAHDVADYVWKDMITLRAGHQCAQPWFTSVGVESAVRASVYGYTTKEDIDRCIDRLAACVVHFR